MLSLNADIPLTQRFFAAIKPKPSDRLRLLLMGQVFELNDTVKRAKCFNVH